MSQTIAIVMSEVFLRRLTPALVPFVRRKQDYRVISIHRPISELHALIRNLGPSGLITEWLPEVTEALLELGLPTVIADTDFTYPGIVSVDVNDWAVGREAALAFSRAGFQSFACLGNETPYSQQRIEGFCQEIGQSVPVHIEPGLEAGPYSEYFSTPSQALTRWLKSLPKPVGIFAVHDPLGRYICSAAESVAMQIPDEISVIAANDDALVCGLSYPMLSSVSIPWHTLGELVVERMQGLLRGEPSPIEPQLVEPGGVVFRHSANHLAVEDAMLRTAMSYMSERMLDPIDIGTMCHELRMSRRTLERKFKEYYRMTPWEMLCKLRVTLAKKLVIETNHSMARIAELSGFNDPERMAVTFKRLLRQPPSSFRRKLSKAT